MKPAHLVLLYLFAAAPLFSQSTHSQPPCTPAPSCDTGQLSAVGADGYTHYYEAYVPEGLPSPPSMLIWLPGMGAGSGAAWNHPPQLPANGGGSYQLKAFADAEKVIVLWIAPTCRQSNATPSLACTILSPELDWYFDINYFSSSMSPIAQDSAFIHSLIGTAVNTWGVDPSRIAMFGFSTGAFMAHRYPLDEPGDVMGIAAFEGQLWAQLSSGCTGLICPETPPYAPATAVYIAHGTADATIPAVGGTFNGWHGTGAPTNKNTFPSVDTTFGYWMNSSCPNGTVTTSGGTNTNIIVAAISSISGNGTMAIATCASTCGANPTGIYAIDGTSNSGFNSKTVVVATDSGTSFTFPSPIVGTGTGGYLYLTSKLVSGCTGNREIEYVTNVGGKHIPPDQTAITRAWQFLALFPLTSKE